MGDEPIAATDLQPSAPVPAPTAERREDELVPAWLAALVLVLLLGVVGVAGYIVRDRFAEKEPRTAQGLAVQNARAAVDKTPDDMQARLNLAFSYQVNGQYKEAIEQYDAVLAKDPKDTAALYNKGMVYMQLKDTKKGETLLWDVLKVSKTHVLAAKALGDHYAAEKQYRSLVEAVKPAADARPDMADLAYLMGLAYENLGHKDWAEGRYRDALKYVPDMSQARDGLRRLGVEP